MPKVIDYWRGLVADVAEAESNSPAHLRAVGDPWYPVLRMRVLTTVHDAAQKRLGPVDLPAAHADQVAIRVWNDLVAAIHKRVAPEAWGECAAVLARARPHIADLLGTDPGALDAALDALPNARLEDLEERVFQCAFPDPLSSRDERAARGALHAFLFRGREWPDLGTWIPFTLFSITARFFEQGHYLGDKLCASESEILDLVELAPYGAEWAREVVRRRAQNRTRDSYLAVLDAILNREPPPRSRSLIARRLTLVEWLSDPEARLARMAEAHGRTASDLVVRRRFPSEEQPSMLAILQAARGDAAYPPGISELERRIALERLVEAMEAVALRTELLYQVSERKGKRGADWAKAVLEARAPRALKAHELALLKAISTRQDSRRMLNPARRNRALRSLHRTLVIAAQPDAGLTLEAVDA